MVPKARFKAHPGRSNPLQCTPVGVARWPALMNTMRPTMHQPADTALFATAVLAVASAALTGLGLRRPRFAGWALWVTAMWLTTLGTAAQALWPGPQGTALAAPLLLQWPLVTLLGLRQFHARRAWPGSPRSDMGLLAGAVLAAAVLPLQGSSEADSAAGLALCSALVHLYAAAVIFMAPGGRDATPLQGLGATMALVAFAPGLALLTPDPTGPLLAAQVAVQTAAQTAAEPHIPATVARAVGAALGSVVLAFVALTLLCERTERQLRESRRRLRVLANMDTLTPVPNRRHFDELASKALRNDPAGSAVLLLFDVDHFKQINDRLGHAAGDRALCLVAGSVLEHLRAHDVAGRQGGDEFVLLLRRASTSDAMAVAQRIAAEVQRRAQAKALPALSLSFGLVQVGAAEPLAGALRRADQALYEAKRQGRSRAVAALGDESRPVFSESRRLGLLPC